MGKNHKDIIEQVPLDYYQKGVRSNFFQRTWHKRKLLEVTKSINGKPEKILDVGCASGWFLSQVVKTFPKSQCYGVDIYRDAILYGKKKYSKIIFKTADAHSLPFPAQTFDVVICTEVLEHIKNPEIALLEIRRVLKKNGQAVIELDSGSILFSVVWYFWKLTRGSVWSHAHLHSFTVGKLERMLKKTGFKIDRKKRFSLGMAMLFSVTKTR